MALYSRLKIVELEVPMKLEILAVTGLAVALTACAPAAPEAPAIDIAAETAALQAAATAYTDAARVLDPSAMAAFYAEDGLAMPPNDATREGPAAFAAYVEEAGGMEGFSVTLDPPTVVMGAGGDMGYSFGLIQITAPGPDGELVTEEERDVHVWRKQPDGMWKIVIDIWNSTTPLPMPDEG
jgi:ketosteroid isomerase-like protein